VPPHLFVLLLHRAAPVVELSALYGRLFELDEDVDIEFKFDKGEGGSWVMVEKDEDVVGSAHRVVARNGADIRRLSGEWIAVDGKQRQWEDMADLVALDIILLLEQFY